MKNLIIVTMLILTISGVTVAQQPVEITAVDVPSEVGLSYDNKIIKGDAIPVNIGTGGANQVWDFTGYSNPTDTKTWTVVEKSSSPFASDFPDANLVYRTTSSVSDTVTHNYVRLNDTDLSELGQGKQVNNQTTFLATSNKIDLKTKFPVKYGDAPWISMPEYASTVKYGIFIVDVIAVDSSYYEIDGWGTLKCELGNINCLRVKQINVRHVFIKQFNLWLRNLTRNVIYNWVAKDYGFIASIKSPNSPPGDVFDQAIEVTWMAAFRAVNVAELTNDYSINDFSLLQNYPNPFNTTTTISYELPTVSWVTLKVFNARGEELAILVQEKQQAGKHAVNWTVADISTGVYFYQIRSDNMVLRKKALFLK